MLGSYPWQKEALGFLRRRRRGRETECTGLGIPISEVSMMKKYDLVFFFWCQIICHSGVLTLL